MKESQLKLMRGVQQPNSSTEGKVIQRSATP